MCPVFMVNPPWVLFSVEPSCPQRGPQDSPASPENDWVGSPGQAAQPTTLTPVTISSGGNRRDVRSRLAERYRRLDEARKKHPVAAVAARFTEIDGATQGGLVSIELFTTVLPLIIIGFDYMSGFAENASPGTLITRQLVLVSPLTERVRAAFGDSAGFRSGWTVVG